MRIVVTGARGFVGSHVARALAGRGHSVIGTRSGPRVAPGAGAPDRGGETGLVAMDLLDEASIRRAMFDERPQGVVHCAAWPELLRCEQDPAGAAQANVDATRAIAESCCELGARLIFISTDQVFDGERGGYRETDATSPINAYGRTKARAEEVIADTSGENPSSILRCSLVYGISPTGLRSPIEQIIVAVQRGERPVLFADEVRTPVLADDIGSACAEILTRPDPPRLLHLGGPDRLSRYDLGRLLARRLEWPESALRRGVQRDGGTDVRRPRDGSLDSTMARAWLNSPPRPVEEGLGGLLASLSRRRAGS